MTETAETLRLDEPQELGDVLGNMLRLFFRHFPVFFTMTLLIVAPLTVLVQGIWEGALADGPDADGPTVALLAESLLQIIVIPPLVTALHVVVVMQIAEWERPGVISAIHGAAPTFLSATVVVVLYTLGVAVGFVFLIAPGVYLAVAWYFGAQVAVVEGRRNVDALSRSSDLVKGRWWATFGRLFVVGIVAALVTAPLSVGVALVENGPAYVVLSTLERTFTLSLSAIAGTLLFFDLRAREPRPRVEFAPPVSPTPAT
jgi:hypothetical protein